LENRGHILLAEDDTHVALPLTFILEATGYQVTTVRDVVEAMTEIDRCIKTPATIDLLICDIQMYGMNGEKILIYRYKQNFKIPVLVMTEFYGTNIMKRLLSLGYTNIIGKPFKQDDIIQRIEGLLSPLRR
jgi:DNA-binding response OmpR family regulator